METRMTEEKKPRATGSKPAKESSQAVLTKQLDKILNDLRDVIAKRNQKIVELREEIEQ